MENAKSRRRLFWAYLLPLLHLSACLISTIAYIVPSLQHLAFGWVILMLVDLPVSVVAYALAWKHGVIAGVWVVVAGTVWWHLLGRGVDFLINKLRGGLAHPLLYH